MHWCTAVLTRKFSPWNQALRQCVDCQHWTLSGLSLLASVPQLKSLSVGMAQISHQVLFLFLELIRSFASPTDNKVMASTVSQGFMQKSPRSAWGNSTSWTKSNHHLYIVPRLTEVHYHKNSSLSMASLTDQECGYKLDIEPDQITTSTPASALPPIQGLAGNYP